MTGSDPLELDPETMRRLGYRVVDMLVDRLVTLDGQPVRQTATREELERRLREPPPAGPHDFDEILARLAEDVLPFASRVDHPRFFAFIPGCPTWPGVLGEWIAKGTHLFQGTWSASGGPSEVELVVVDWFREWLGLPPETAGLLVSGGSHANLTGLACAREARLGVDAGDAVVYASTQVHSSVGRALRVLGFPADQLRLLAPDESFRLRPNDVEAAIAEDLRAGLRPFAVVANAGATNTGAVDPLAALRSLCDEHGLWLHVDAAYGGFAALTDRGRAALAGLGAADSVVLDPHKWLYQPYDAGCVLVRDGGLLEAAFSVLPEYMQDTAVTGEEVNFADRGIELTRAARALKIWVSLQYFGVDAFRACIDRSLDLILEAEERIRRSPALELLTPATLGIVCFRRRLTGSDESAHERANAALVDRITAGGLAMVSSTRLDDRYAVRLCVLNHRTRSEDVERVLRFFEQEPTG
jgi:glutamate/tyrosine decarboxylase-like PLP-dependent enzyme